MRISRLELKAYGPFTDRTLELGPGLHVIYGPNEAGKSSTLRALKAWLFGFPERTHDNFLHANDQLQVGGRLEAEDGRRLTFSRRKKRKADMLDPEGQPLGADALAAFLPIREQAVFESLYGLSYEDLVRGGEDILAQKGEVGQALFSAGAGISSLRGVLASFENEAEALFLARGKREINETIAAYKETQKIVRESSLSSRDWHELDAGLREARAALQAVEEQRAQKDRRLRQMERLLQLFPQLVLRGDLKKQLEALGQVVVLPDDFPARHHQLERDLHSLTRREADLAAKLSQREKREPLSPYQAVLDAEEAIEALHQRFGSYIKGREDQPSLEGMRISARREAAEFLRMVRQDISLEQVESLRPVSGRRKLIGDLAIRHEGLKKELAQAEKELREFRHEIGLLDEELTRLPLAKDTAPLTKTCRLARMAGTIDEDLTSRTRLLEDKKRHCQSAINRLSLWSGSLEQFLQLPFPLLETVREFAAAFQSREEQQRDIQKERERLTKRLHTLQADILQLETSGNTPTEEELVHIRAQRDRGWELLRRQWLNGEDLAGEDTAFAQDLSLPEAYEKKITQADAVADRLRYEADRVQAFAAMRTEAQSLNNELVALEDAASRNTLAFTERETQWQILWAACNITPLSPKEMLGWLVDAAALRDKLDEMQEDERILARKKEQRQELISALSRELAALDQAPPPKNDALEPLLLSGEAVLTQLTSTGDKRDRLLEKRLGLVGQAALREGKIADLSQDLLRWSREWQEVIAELGTSRDIHPAEAGDLLDNLHSCFAKLKEAEDLRRRIDGITRDNDRFEEAALALAQKVAPASATLPTVEIVAQLKVLLKQARTDKTLRDGYLKKEREEAEAALRLAGERKDLEHELALLCRQAGGILPAELEKAEKLSDRYRNLADRLAEIEKILIEGAGGLPISELETQAGRIDPDALPDEIARLTQEIEQDLAPEGKRLSELIGEKKNQLRQMDGNGRAAEAAEQGARLLARIQRLAQRYIQLKVAGHVLKNEIERFRSENQAPVLAITSRYFSALTLGSFSGLLTDENDQGEPVLVGTKPNNARVSVEHMSSGTRDQLYLALRLASLDWRLDGHEPMPFILDDILVNADDARSRVALKILAGLAARTQVILFTHHRRIVEEVREVAQGSDFQVHELGA